MATYSRSDSSSQTATATQVLPSKDLSSVIVKSLENIVKENNDSKNEQETITDAINNSNLNSLLEKKEKDTNTKQLENLLVKSPSVNKMLTQTLSQNIGKVVGGAVAVSFGAVGKVISGAIGGLQKAVHAPLKTIVTKLALGAAIGSQIFVFLEGALAKFLSEKDLRIIDITARIESKVKTIPDKIKLSLEQILSKVKIAGQPIYGSISKEEKEELQQMAFDERLLPFANALEALEKSQTSLSKQEEFLQLFANNNNTGVNASDYDLTSERGRQAFKEAILANADYRLVSRDELSQATDQQLNEYIQAMADVNRKQYDVEYLKNYGDDAEFIQRFLYLKGQSETVRDDTFYQKELDKIKAKEYQNYSQAVQQGLLNQMVTGNLTEKKAQLAADKFGWGSQLEAAKIAYQGQYGDYNYAPATGAEQFLDNQYQKWTDSWTKLFRDFTSQMGIVIQQKSEVPNTTRTIGAK